MLGTKILEEKKSKYNGNLRVVRTFGLGTYIQANGLTQSGGVVESIWKSTLRHIATGIKHPIKNCLILGLGGGTVAKLVQKYWPEAKITGVDIDPLIVEMGTRYLALDTRNTKIVIQDAFDYCLMPNTYDLIIVDLYCGDRFPKKFETDKFLLSLKKISEKGRIIVFNRLFYKNKKAEAEKFAIKLQKIFINVKPFRPSSNIMYICS